MIVVWIIICQCFHIISYHVISYVVVLKWLNRLKVGTDKPKLAVSVSPVNIRFNPKKIARKGFSTVSGTISCGE